jgi:uncharacterized protein
MGFEQYHEPANELSQETRTFARMIASLIEEADAINWYEQRMSVETDPGANAIMADAQGEEFKHFGMDLDFSCGASRSGRGSCRRSCFRKATSSNTENRPKKDNG